ncbi:MAG: branched-chain amino acid ABC transporter permease, partial [Candidatus Rokuibacteriota bacterium]
MIYREAGQFKTSYAADQAVFPIVQDRVVVGAFLALAFVVPPLLASEYWLQAVLIPFLVYAMATVGLNLLTGYAGQVSLGTGGFMAVGAYAAFKLTTAFPGLSILVVFVLAGVMAAAVGIVFGLPSLRIKGFYLAVATLAAQFFLIWLFNKVAWFVNYASSGTITAPPRTVLGVMVTGPEASAAARYVVALGLVVVFGVIAKNLVRGRVGRSWMAIRDRDIAAEIIGVRPLRTKLLAFAISSFYCGIAGSMLVFLFLGSAETQAFDINQSFLVLFMVIIGGLGSMIGSFFGAALIHILPIAIRMLPEALGLPIAAATVEHLT